MQRSRPRRGGVLAIDTNVVVRYLTGDDSRQAAIARRQVDGGPVWVARTVLLETEWVLRSAYGFPPKLVCAALRDFAGLPTVTVETPAVAAQALAWLEAGMDFADALHLAAAEEGMSFATFDRGLAARARKAGIDRIKPL